MDISYICDRIEARKEELFQLLSKLIQFNSENFGSFGNEQPVAEYVLDQCRKLGLETDLYSPMELDGFAEHPDYFPGRNLENRPNVTARWKGAENEDVLMLMGHTDTVPIGERSGWKVDPLGGELIDGKIYGRGACDDKYAVAASLFLIRLLQEEGFVPKKNLLFTAYSDEEFGGSHGALAAVLKYPCQIYANLDCRDVIWNCAAGGQVVRYTFEANHALDSSEATARILPVVLDELNSFKEKRRKELESIRFFRGTIIPETSLRYQEIGASIEGTAPSVGTLVFTFYTDKTREVIWEEFAQLEEAIAQRLQPLGYIGGKFIPATRFFHYGYTEAETPAIQEMLAAAKEATGSDLTVCGSCLSDLSVILKYGGGSAFSYGAGRDFSVEGGAHQPNEFITCDGFLKFTKTVAAYILRVLG